MLPKQFQFPNIKANQEEPEIISPLTHAKTASNTPLDRSEESSGESTPPSKGLPPVRYYSVMKKPMRKDTVELKQEIKGAYLDLKKTRSGDANYQYKSTSRNRGQRHSLNEDLAGIVTRDTKYGINFTQK